MIWIRDLSRKHPLAEHIHIRNYRLVEKELVQLFTLRITAIVLNRVSFIESYPLRANILSDNTLSILAPPQLFLEKDTFKCDDSCNSSFSITSNEVNRDARASMEFLDASK